MIDLEEALLVLRKWQEEETPLRVVLISPSLHFDSEAVLCGATSLRFGLKPPGAANFFELDFGPCGFDLAHDPDAPEQIVLVCVRSDFRLSFTSL